MERGGDEESVVRRWVVRGDIGEERGGVERVTRRVW